MNPNNRMLKQLPQNKSKKGAPARTKGQGKKESKVLLVASDRTIKKDLAIEFELKGFRVVCVTNGKKALESLQTQQVDVIVVDTPIIGMDEKTLVNEIHKTTEETPVLAFVMSQFPGGEVETLLKESTDEVYIKPLDAKAMVSDLIRYASEKQHLLRRSFERFDIDNLRADLVMDLTGQKVTVPVTNVGKGGMFLEKEYPMPKEQERFAFKVYDPENPELAISGRAEVVWRRTHEVDGMKPGCGVKFTEMDGPSLANLSLLLKS